MTDSVSSQSRRPPRLQRQSRRKGSDESGDSGDSGDSGNLSGDYETSASTAAGIEVKEDPPRAQNSSRAARRSSAALPPYVPNYTQRRHFHCRCGCGCSEKERWPVHQKRSKCAGVMGAVLVCMADSESEGEEIEEKMEKYETEKEKYEFRVHHGFEEEGYRLGPR